jgi:hypothetical protein
MPIAGAGRALRDECDRAAPDDALPLDERSRDTTPENRGVLGSIPSLAIT